MNLPNRWFLESTDTTYSMLAYENLVSTVFQVSYIGIVSSWMSYNGTVVH